MPVPSLGTEHSLSSNRSHDLIRSVNGNLPAQPRRVYLVGGASPNSVIFSIPGKVLVRPESVYRLGVGENACALAAAYRVVWAVPREDGVPCEILTRRRWDKDQFGRRVADGYQKGLFVQYRGPVDAFTKEEREGLKAGR